MPLWLRRWALPKLDTKAVKRTILLILNVAAFSLPLHAQSDPSFHLKPANDLRTFSVKDTGCSSGTCPLQRTAPLCPNGHCIATRSYGSMSPYLSELKESLGAIERIPNYKDFAQLERAAVQLRDIIWRTEHQAPLAAASPLGHEGSAEPLLGQRSHAAGDRQPILTVSSPQIQHELCSLLPTASQWQGSPWSLVRRDGQSVSCAVNTP